MSSLHDYGEMIKALGYFTYRYGKLDWLESNNEYWLRQDARLRREFNIRSGIQIEQIDGYQRKSKMKEAYAGVGIKTARWCVSEDREELLSFANTVGYPLIAKPDIGVGAGNTHKLENEEDLLALLAGGFSEPMIFEEFIYGSVTSYDGIVNAKGEILFETSHVYTSSIMDAVNKHQGIGCYSRKELPRELKEAGRRTVAAFHTRSRFFHFEFFVLDQDQEGVGHKGDVLGLEVNMRPPGGFLPDLINYANDFNIYQLWADMIVSDQTQMTTSRPYSAIFIGRRDSLAYRRSMQDLRDEHKEAILDIRRMPEVLAQAMGDVVVLARFESEEAAVHFAREASECV